MTPRTVFITGGGSGIGMGLARAYHARGAQVIIAGRTLATLQAVAADCPGMQTEVLDVADPTALTACAGAGFQRDRAAGSGADCAGN
jgi:uncharacterized oxidoreductase